MKQIITLLAIFTSLNSYCQFERNLTANECREIVEAVCKNGFNEGFIGRKYLSASFDYVENTRVDDYNAYIIYGVVSYYNFLDILDASNYKLICTIRNNRWRYRFWKRSYSPFREKGDEYYWEDFIRVGTKDVN